MNLSFTRGDITIHRVIEQQLPFTDPLEFLPGLTPELLAENRSWMEQSGALDPATGRLNLCIQSYVVRTPDHTVLIDSCVGNDKDRPARPTWHMRNDDAYLRALAGAGFRVEDIDAVMCTHLHVDHVGWNTRLENGRWVPTFPNARYLFARKEFDYWTAKHAEEPIGPIGDSVLPVVEAGRADLVASDLQFSDHLRLLPTPGHTPDHFAVILGRGEEAVVTGDLIHSPIQARYPEISMRFDYDQAQSASTRRNFLERFCDKDTLCCTAHFPSPSGGRIRRWGEGFRCDPV
jgi:glyoxylase-like metal-dependent hydrolase (beta-lactamase superfamily II)